MKLSSDIAAVVTGGASGLGEATARALAAKGVRVGIFDMNEERGQNVADDISGIFTKVDVSSNDSVDQGIDFVRAANGQERIMINCAGIGMGMKTASRKRDTGEISAHDPAVFMKVIEINLIGSFLCASKSAAGMMSLDPTDPDGERGVIINTASVAAQDGQIGQVAYAASKGGILSMALPMARDLAREGIRVATIAHALSLTPLLQGLPAEDQDSLGKQVPFPQRLGRPDEFAGMVGHIFANTMLNGETIRLDGAIRMAPK